MPRFLYRLLAACLALLWGPLTWCCAMESAGIELPCCATQCGDETGTSLPTEGCSLVEEGNYVSNPPVVKGAPSQVALFCVLVSRAALAGREPVAADRRRAERPRDWLPGWHFERRAAAPAHAPDSLIA